ncbi:hypothetical protein LB505_013439 [Fusarium chuoi]|nr:hypothetical protein LB505_013439 [Fusarium chuoi]
MAVLSFANVALLGAGYIAFCALWQIVRYRFFHPLRKFPGNFWGTVTRLWITYHNVKADECATFQELHKKHESRLRCCSSVTRHNCQRFTTVTPTSRSTTSLEVLAKMSPSSTCKIP